MANPSNNMNFRELSNIPYIFVNFPNFRESSDIP